jgi:hypothetical protein
MKGVRMEQGLFTKRQQGIIVVEVHKRTERTRGFPGNLCG